ncbi:Pr6Pr family membrane protein [[Acholeplasma] multilocale]|uniref:Pr6Pr family membrane protein n=1 Tax=[Acholeplasma] multilocale TaxID=264638 RepID=UPI00047C02E7|nr:Pr6Pr family membrane protein [[Acholeplasma] multilocale]
MTTNLQESKFKVNLNKFVKRFDFSDYRTWYKLIIGIGMLSFILAIVIVDIVDIFELRNQVDAYLKTVGDTTDIQTIKDGLAQYIGDGISSQKLAWVNISQQLVESVNDKDVMVMEFFTTVNIFGYIVFYFSYFTTLSNVLIAVWLTYAAFAPQREGVKGLLSSKGAILTATYITITMLIYNLVLLPVGLMAGNGIEANWYWVNQFGLHLIMPLLFIAYAVFMMDHKNEELAKAKVFQQWLMQFCGLIGYAIYTFIRGGIREGMGNKIASTNFPYFFVELWHKDPLHAGKYDDLGNYVSGGIHGAILFFVVVIIIAAFMIGFSTLYMYIIRQLNKRKG